MCCRCIHAVQLETITASSAIMVAPMLRYVARSKGCIAVGTDIEDSIHKFFVCLPETVVLIFNSSVDMA